MKIKNQFLISIIGFTIVLAAIAVSVIFTQSQTTQLNNQEGTARDIQTGASNLNYISNNYFLYQDNSSIALWQSQSAALSDDLSELKSTNPQQQALVDNVNTDLQHLNNVFDGVVVFLESAPRNISVRILPEFQTDWSRMASQIQALSFDAQRLSQNLRDQVDQANFENIILIIAFIGLFGIYFLTNYVITYRRTFKAISELQEGIAVVGSGNLDYLLKADKKDEVGEISRSVNQMTANLKTVTASKTDLEREIKTRKKAEQEIAQAKQRLDAHMNNAPEAVIEFDPQFRVIRWSEEATKVFGWSAEEIIGRCITEMPWVYENDSQIVQRVSADMINGKRPRNVSYNRNYRKDGSVIDCEWYNSAIYDSDGNLVSILSQVLDVTKRKKSEEALKNSEEVARHRAEELERMQAKLEEKAAEVEEYATRMEQLAEERAIKLKDAERLAAIGATAGMVGHDIRNPLQSILSELYLAKAELNEIAREDVKHNLGESIANIEGDINYINKIVQDLQDFAKPVKPAVKEADLQALCQEVLQKTKIPQNIKKTCRIDDDAKQMTTDPDVLKRAVENLVINAVQAMQDGGKLSLHAYQDAGSTIITVEDTGMGIPEEVRSKLFTPLFTTKSKGQGFGLAVVKRMTEALGGTVSYESKIGKGTMFIIRLPLPKKQS